jgi:hypothetical protein
MARSNHALSYSYEESWGEPQRLQRICVRCACGVVRDIRGVWTRAEALALIQQVMADAHLCGAGVEEAA